MTVDLFPHILANVVDIQKEHFLLQAPVLNKTPRLSSARMFVRLIDCCLCMYICISNKTTRTTFHARLDTGSIRSLKATRKAIMLCSMACHQRYIAHYVHSKSNNGSMCDCKSCRNLDLSVLMEILSGVDSDHGTVST